MAVTLDIMLGDYPHTRALRDGTVRSDAVDLRFADVSTPSSAFKRAVALEFDVAELSVPTFLIAKSRGVPLALLPADLFARAKPPELTYDARGKLCSVADFQGKRIGVNYYTATTSIWMQTRLANAGVDPGQVQWIAVEGPQIAEYQDPPHVERARLTETLTSLLHEGRVDAVVTTALPTESYFRAVTFPEESLGRFAPMQSHHMLVVKEDVLRREPDAIRAFWQMMLEAKAMAPAPPAYGWAGNAAHLDAVIDACHGLGIIDRRFSIGELAASELG